MKIVISVKLTKNGFLVFLNQQKHQVNYPLVVWHSFPDALKLIFAEYICYITTVHLAYEKKNKLIYQFPNPAAQSFFAYGVLLSIPENIVDLEIGKHKTSELLQLVLNSFYQVSFTGLSRSISIDPFKSIKNTALVPFSFGKDSLLTYGLCQKLNIAPTPFFFLEPTNKAENKHKLKLIKKFKEEFNSIISTFKPPLAHLRQEKGLAWGWDIFLTQYTIFLIPFLHYFKSNYLFWSNEFNCNEIVPDTENFLVNKTFEQSGAWMQATNSVLRLFGCPTKLGSLLEPLSELAIISMLHDQFPLIAKYQASCTSDDPNSSKNRWCGNCFECARTYLYVKALGIKSESIDFTQNMFAHNKRKLFYLFDMEKQKLHNMHYQFTYTFEEKMLAFYLVYKKGIRGQLIDEFKIAFPTMTAKKAHYLIKKYFHINETSSVPLEVNNALRLFYAQNLRNNLQKMI